MIQGRDMVKYIVILAVLIMAAACSSDKQSEQSPPSPPANSEEQPGKAEETQPDPVQQLITQTMKDPIELTIYYFWQRTYEDFMDVYGNDMIKKYPNIKINWIQNGEGTSPQDIVATGVNVDLYYSTVGNMRGLMDLGIDPDISDLLKKYQFDTSVLEPVFVDFLQEVNGGGFAGVPFVSQTLAMFYNKDVFDKFGVDYIQDGVTWDEIYEKARLLTREDGGVMYRGYGETWFPNQFVLNQLSMPLIDSKTNTAAFDNDAWKAFLRNFARLHEFPGYEPTPAIVSGAAPRAGFTGEQTYAINPRNNGDFPRKSLGEDFNWDVVTYPSFSQAPNVGTQPQLVYYVIPKHAKNRDAAFLAATELMNKELQLKYSRNGMPSVLKDSAIREVFGADVADLQGKNAKALIPVQYAPIIEQNIFNDYASNELMNALQRIILGETDVNTAFREAAEKVDQHIKAQLGN